MILIYRGDYTVLGGRISMPETTPSRSDSGSDQHSGALKPNTILKDRYKIIGVTDGGVLGTVYQAQDIDFSEGERLVAIREMWNSPSDSNFLMALFTECKREVTTFAALKHPTFPQIFDFFDHNDCAYLVMEFINGNDLETIINKTKELPIEKIIEWAIALCDVLDYLHNHQPKPIIFRDIKPANIMIDINGRARLMDYRIRQIYDRSATSHTMIGTEGYAAPEQYKGNVSPLSDIYSLGATLHHLITRTDPRLESPFSFNERPIQEYCPEAPKALVDIVDKALAFGARERYQNCAEMKAALEYLPVDANSVHFATSGDMPKPCSGYLTYLS
jgi:eukaryotic-like serine/threonine-protein kinase